MTKIYDEFEDSNLGEVVEEHNLQPLQRQAYRSDRISNLWDLSEKGFEALAWNSGVKYVFYNVNTGILIEDVEGDLFIYKDPSLEQIEEKVQRYHKKHVSFGEQYDGRFPSQSPPSQFRED